MKLLVFAFAAVMFVATLIIAFKSGEKGSQIAVLTGIFVIIATLTLNIIDHREHQ